MTIVVYLQHNA